MPFTTVTPVIDRDVRTLCARPYPGHRRGCPNFGKRPSCPPWAGFIHEAIDLRQPVWAIWNVYPFGEHVERMRAKHPDWSERQLACCLYWQGTARKQLEAEITAYLKRVNRVRHVVLRCPEALGVNVTATMRSLGHRLEWPPRNIAYQVALTGVRKGAWPE